LKKRGGAQRKKDPSGRSGGKKSFGKKKWFAKKSHGLKENLEKVENIGSQSTDFRPSASICVCADGLSRQMELICNAIHPADCLGIRITMEL
tara:strand:+ start:550 stop:825 length:276 start_codon:yes stop_codon:yes gene_type:complete